MWSFGYWASIFTLKNKDRFEHEIVLKILSKSEPSCSYKIVLIKKRVYSVAGYNVGVAGNICPLALVCSTGIESLSVGQHQNLQGYQAV